MWLKLKLNLIFHSGSNLTNNLTFCLTDWTPNKSGQINENFVCIYILLFFSPYYISSLISIFFPNIFIVLQIITPVSMVKQMGSTMKPTIFNERVATALKNWHHTAKKHIKESRHSGMATPMSSRPATPSRGTSPIHLLRYYRGEIDSLPTSPRKSNFDMDNWDNDGSPSPSPTRFQQGEGSSTSHHQIELGYIQHEADLRHEPSSSRVVPLPQPPEEQQEISIGMPNKDFSFDKRTST